MEKTLTLKINRYDYNLTILLTIFVTSAIWLWFIYAMNIASARKIHIPMPSYQATKLNNEESKLKQEILQAQREKKMKEERKIERERELMENNIKISRLYFQIRQGSNIYSKHRKYELMTDMINCIDRKCGIPNSFLLPEEPEPEPAVQHINLEDLEITRDMALNERTGLSKEDVIKLIESKSDIDTSGFFAENAAEIYDLCEEYEINEIFFCGLIAAESGWDITGDHRTKFNYISSMGSKSMLTYNSKKEGLEEAAKLLHEKYLTEGGDYYHGATIDGVQKSFCSESPQRWQGLVYGCMNLLV